MLRFEKPTTKLKDVMGLQEAKRALLQACDLPARFPSQYPGSTKARSAVMLYGPPGTGKTRFAEAVAGQFGYVFFNVSSRSSKVVSK